MPSTRLHMENFLCNWLALFPKIEAFAKGRLQKCPSFCQECRCNGRVRHEQTDFQMFLSMGLVIFEILK